MIITTNKNIEYDTVGRFYYLTDIGAEALTGYTLKWNNKKARLKKHGRTLKRYLTLNPYNDNFQPQYRPIDFFEYMVFKNENDEVNYIQEMLVEMVEWAYDTDGDRAVYEDGGGERVPETVKDIAMTQGLAVIGKCNIFIEDDEYRVGY